MKKISAIVTCYNNEKDIEKCLKSIFDQTYQNIEIIIIDDGSTDASLESINKIVSNKNNVKVFYNRNNKGPSYSRNIGISNATGDYTLFIDADDYIENYYVEKLVNAITNNQDLIICGFKYVSTKGKSKSINALIFDVRKSDFINKYYLYYLEKELLFGPINKLYKTDVLKKISFNNNYRIREDAIFVMDYIREAKTFASINSSGYNYIQHEIGKSLISKLNANEFEANYELYKKMLLNIKEYDEMDKSVICKFYVSAQTELIKKTIRFKKLNYKKATKMIDEIMKNKDFKNAVYKSLNKRIINIVFLMPNIIIWFIINYIKK